MPEQPAAGVDAAHGGDPYGEWRQFADLNEDLLRDETLVAYRVDFEHAWG